jgi:high-affinity iron transporter
VTDHRARAALAALSAVVALIGVGIAVATAADAAGSAATGRSAPIPVTEVECADGWTPPHSGQRQLTFTNSGTAIVDVSLVGTAHALVYGEIEALAPGTTRTMTAIIPPGRYQLWCTYSENALIKSAAAAVTGPPVDDANPYLPATYSQVAPLVATYRADVAAGLDTLASDTDRLRALADAGQREQAEGAWLVAHLDYERLGAAYDTFGSFADEIDGRPNGLPLGVNDPGWTGFLRLEYALWQGQPAATVARVADQLDGAVHGLVAAFPEQPTPINDLSLRTHEILEKTLQFQLTGETDQGSHTGLATALANVQGTEMTLGAIAPLLGQNEPALLASATSGLHRLAALLATYQSPDGTWRPVQSLSQTQREVLDGTVSSLLETLAPIPDILELQPEAQSP